jgi:hypothetical protein
MYSTNIAGNLSESRVNPTSHNLFPSACWGEGAQSVTWHPPPPTHSCCLELVLIWFLVGAEFPQQMAVVSESGSHTHTHIPHTHSSQFSTHCLALNSFS